MALGELALVCIGEVFGSKPEGVNPRCDGVDVCIWHLKGGIGKEFRSDELEGQFLHNGCKIKLRVGLRVGGKERPVE